MSSIPTGQPSVEVSIGNTDLSDTKAYRDLMRVTVSDEDRGTSSFELHLLAWSKETFKLSWVDDDLFKLGGEVTIKMGYVGKLTRIMVGEITSKDLDVSAGEVPTLRVRGYDLSHRMSRATTSYGYFHSTDNEVAAEIARRNGLNFTAPAKDPLTPHLNLTQFNQTDLEFLQTRAKANSYEVKVIEKELFFQPRIDPGPPKITLSAESDLMSFSASLSAKGMVDTVEVSGWDQAKKEAIRGKCSAVTAEGGKAGSVQAKDAFKTAKVIVMGAPVFDQGEADQLAKAKLEELNSTFVRASCSCFGRTDLRAGIAVKIDGVGEPFEGRYDITQSSHTYDANNSSYRTSLTLRSNAT
jgi:phage protein D